ncbi:MAG: histidine kinase [Segetibacter sp.]|nr:histidine kinase [Segetibacter sp.]
MPPALKNQSFLNKIYDTDFLKPIIDTISEGVVVFNDSSVVIACNLPATEIFGLHEDEILGSILFKKGWTLIEQDGSPFKVENLPSVITIKTGKPCNNIILGVDTSVFFKWLKVKSTLLNINNIRYVIVSFSDITEQSEINNKLSTANNQLHALLNELSNSEDKFYAAFNYSGIGIGLVSVAGKWLNVNPQMSKMLGYSKEEFLSMSWQDITHADDLAEDIEFTKKLLSKKLSSYQMEKRYFHKNGKIVWVLLCVSLVWKTEDMPDFFISQVMDITSAKQLSQELGFKNKVLQTTTESLEKRMKQVKEFNHIVAHNLRGPSATIHMLIDLIKQENNEEQKSEYLKMLSDSNDQFQKTLQNLLQLLQYELNNKENTAISDFEETVESVKSQLMGSIISTKAIIKTHFEVASLSIPKAFLESIIYNLLSNAIKYSKRNITPIIEISTCTIDNKIQLAVKDNGIGIDLNKYGSDVFKLNKTFHTGYDSKGIGLYMTKNQIENAGGSIKVESVPGEGTTFKVLF